jgi:hypothetical protein
MAGQANKSVPEHVWRVPLRLEDVPETGRHIELTADAALREAVAEFAGVNAVAALSATFDVARRGKDGLRVSGEVRARVGQTCVVTLEPMESEIVEPVDVIYEPPQAEVAPQRAAPATPGATGSPGFDEEEDPPEPLVDGIADLGALATEFLLLGIDPYPRKPGATFEQPAANTQESGPFAALLRLKRGGDGEK